VQALLTTVNTGTTLETVQEPLFGAVIGKYRQEELPEQYATRSSYLSMLRLYIEPKWATVPTSKVKTMDVEAWLKAMPGTPKSKQHRKALLHVIFNCAIRWELADKNPVTLARVKGGSKRQSRPTIITPEQFHSILPHLKQPYRTMVLIAGALGLRASEIMPLAAADFDFENLTLLVQRGCVSGHIGDVKTEYSRDAVPLDPALASEVRNYLDTVYPTSEGWLFWNPKTGKPFHQDSIQANHLIPAGRAAGISNLGWKVFRHSYRSWLDEAGTPIGVMKELMRHSQIATTMNVYGCGQMSDAKRRAHGKVVEMVLRQPQKAETLSGAKDGVSEPKAANGI